MKKFFSFFQRFSSKSPRIIYDKLSNDAKITIGVISKQGYARLLYHEKSKEELLKTDWIEIINTSNYALLVFTDKGKNELSFLSPVKDKSI